MIAIIPARGGSKGLPGKNIKELCGKPLIAYTIEAALGAEEIDRVIVSTDSMEIAEIAEKYGAEVPFMRPAELANDTASAVDVYLHAVSFVEQQTGIVMDKFMVLLPTAPLRKAEHIKEALGLFRASKANTLVSMKEADTPISWYFEKDEIGRVHNAELGKYNAIANRQCNQKYYIPNGAIYILDTKLLRSKRTYYDDNTFAYIMSAEESVDIDYEFEFEMAEYLMKRTFI